MVPCSSSVFICPDSRGCGWTTSALLRVCRRKHGRLESSLHKMLWGVCVGEAGVTQAMHSGRTLGPLRPSGGALHLGPSKLFTPLEGKGSAHSRWSANIPTRLSILRSPMLYLSLTEAPQRTRSWVPVMRGFLLNSRAFYLPPAQRKSPCTQKSADSYMRMHTQGGRPMNSHHSAPRCYTLTQPCVHTGQSQCLRRSDLSFPQA